MKDIVTKGFEHLNIFALSRCSVVRRAVSRRILMGIVAAALTGIAGIAAPAHAGLLPYIYLPLDKTGLFQSTGWGATEGYAVGYGAGDATGGNQRALAWNLATGTRTILDDTDLIRSNGFGATNGYAVGNISNNIVGDKTAVWDLNTGVRTILPTVANNAFSYINRVSGGVAAGYQNINGGNVATAWDVASKSMISLDTTGFFDSFATGATGSTVVGYGTRFLPDFSSDVSAYTWNKNTGVRGVLDKTGFASAHAYGASDGLILGDVQLVANGTGQAVAWDTFSGTRTLLDSTGLQGSNAFFAWNGVVFGSGTAIGSNQNRPLAWDLNTGTRYDLTSLIFPAGSQNVFVNGVDEFTGTLTGSMNGDAHALVVISNSGNHTVDVGQIANAPATYAQEDGTNTVNGTFRFTNPADNNYRLEGGILKGNGTIDGNLLNLGGTVAPGNSPGTLTVTGDYTQTSGIYSVELASLSSFDQLAVGGAASFTGGSLLIEALSGYTPTIGDVFDIVTTGNGITIGSISVTDGYTFTQDGNIGKLTFVGAAVVPEANTALLALLAASTVLVFVRRRK